VRRRLEQPPIAGEQKQQLELRGEAAAKGAGSRGDARERGEDPVGEKSREGRAGRRSLHCSRWRREKGRRGAPVYGGGGSCEEVGRWGRRSRGWAVVRWE